MVVCSTNITTKNFNIEIYHCHMFVLLPIENFSGLICSNHLAARAVGLRKSYVVPLARTISPYAL